MVSRGPMLLLGPSPPLRGKYTLFENLQPHILFTISGGVPSARLIVPQLGVPPPGGSPAAITDSIAAAM